jgi:AraC-like DNA-binding protein
MPAHQAIVRRITRSQILSDYEIAFVKASGLPLRFDPIGKDERTTLPLQNHPSENPFCALISKTQEGCRMCQAVDAKLRNPESDQPTTEVCIAGLADTAVPIMVQGRVAGHLRTGQIALEPPSRDQFTRIARTLMDWGLHTDLTQLEEAWFHSRVLTPAQYEAFIELLKVFARHIGLTAEQLPSLPPETESPVIQRARAYIELHQKDDVNVEEVAQTLNLSVFYFCKIFKKATGKTFTEYLSEVRVMKAKNLLLNPHARISEVAFESGFQSITHFNRIFKKRVGVSPSRYRMNLLEQPNV